MIAQPVPSSALPPPDLSMLDELDGGPRSQTHCPHCHGPLTPTVDEVTIDIESRHILIRGRRVRVPPQSWRLLSVLYKRVGLFVSRDHLILTCLNEDSDPMLLRQHISRLRKFLTGTSWAIETLYGEGYRLVKPCAKRPSLTR